jgi:hypothetical protein
MTEMRADQSNQQLLTLTVALRGHKIIVPKIDLAQGETQQRMC